jgi:hypothetical protein
MSIAGTIASVFCKALATEVTSLTSAAMLDPPSFLPAACHEALSDREPQSRRATRHHGVAAIEIQLIH